MPIESSKPQVGHNLGLDFGAYIQGKSFTRSVSISETIPVPSDVAASSDSAAVLPSSGRFASGGTGGAAQPSPSPLSSTTATISPESPLPSSVSTPVSLDETIHPHIYRALCSPPQDSVASLRDCSPSSTSSISSLVPLPCCSVQTNSSSLRMPSPYAPEFIPVFQNPVTQRTVSLVAHLVDSRLSPEWREAFFNKSIPQTTVESTSPTSRINQSSASSGILSHSTATDTTDSASGSARRPVPPTPSPSEDVSVVKRFKQDEVEPSKHSSQSQLEKHHDSCHHSIFPHSNNQQFVPSSFISLRLASCICRLADHFESRYRDKLGDLLEDVARLSYSSAEEDSGAESSGAVVSDANQSSQASSLQKSLDAARCRFHHVLNELFAERINWGRVIAMLAFVRALSEHVENTIRLPGEIAQTCTHSSASDADTELENLTETTSIATATDHTHHYATEADGVRAPALQTLPENSSPNSTSGEDHINGGLPMNGGLRAAHYVAWTAEFVHGSHGIWDWIKSNGGWDGLIDFESERSIRSTAHVADRPILGLTDDDAVRLLRRAVTGVATIAVGAVGLVAALRFFTKRL